MFKQTAAESAFNGSADQARPVTDREIDALVRRHLPLVGHIVRETLGRVPAHVSRDDLVSAGMYALAAAAKAFDPSHSVTFASYAAIRIRGAIADELRSRDWASRSVRGKARELEQVRNHLATTLGRLPSREEVAQGMGVTVREVDNVEADTHRASLLSLQALTPQDSDELVPAAGDDPEGLLVRREQLGYLRDAVEELPERLRTVVRGYFFEQRKMVDIAAELGVTESRVSQLRSEALGMLRAGMKAADGEVETVEVPKQGRLNSRETARAAYAAAVSARSTLASRLAASNLLGEPVAAGHAAVAVG
ncbi:RNA polymerase, sigma 28 subunit, SigD/FliA/WhiG [Jatrophihabitans endophyticus]|uniref:RNA polymerase, sigma 28 subunit, SigD/FliA/WhiG n=1 Tax=Jatrophihabitans endophyticus TaxID=1206085 RepID=A0A1M5IEB3_9ACTN|nr:FliA/WhiG family RNA polymerase sigma factor [Jatrophihabitans endophyticus]SHG26611.1 RNA polymerase, sigma 28 subunit, SigD/FliA/WhiG [Jatrophihabitans endophyticus]